MLFNMVLKLGLVGSTVRMTPLKFEYLFPNYILMCIWHIVALVYLPFLCQNHKFEFLRKLVI